MKDPFTITPKFPKILHGGDYNPEQWLSRPDILERDIELMKEAKVNCVSVGIFSWSMLEPEDGVYDFDWLDQVIDRLYENGIYTILATPTGARPVWMSQKYPEVLRVEANRVRKLQGGRHNHCFTSPVYRHKTREMNTRLAQRYANHPAVIMWHVSNELGGECHCPLCQQAFRDWLRAEFGSLDKINEEWWTTFWSHRYTDFSQIESPAPHGERNVHGLNLAWKRFITHQTIDFLKEELAPLREANPEIPVTVNMMGFYDGLNYFKFKDIIDVVSWDSYPSWHHSEDQEWEGLTESFYHDIMRAMKQQPFVLMESTPSTTNWISVSRLKRPGMHMLASLNAVGHGSNTVQYFQWRQSRGSAEKFHGAVVSHRGTNDTRIFKDVCAVGEALCKLGGVYDTGVKAEVAILYDVENKWAIDDSKGPRNAGMGYVDQLKEHYRAFWKRGVPVDGVDMECDLSGYKLVIAPMLYMLRADIARKLADFVENGGTLVTTYFTGLVNENDLCFIGETPAQGLSDVLGIWWEEIEGLYDHQSGSIVITSDRLKALKAGKAYKTSKFAEIIHTKTAQVLAEHGSEFYKGTPSLTVNAYGKGEAYHIAVNTEQKFYSNFYKALIKKLDIFTPFGNSELAHGCSCAVREGAGKRFYFIGNYNEAPATVETGMTLRDCLTGEVYEKEVLFDSIGIKVLVEA